MDPVTALEAAISIAGGQSELARKLGKPVRQGHIWGWLRNEKRKRRGAPPEHCVAIEKITDGRITRYDLQPEVFGAPPERSAHGAG